jgi:hypothetical protein
MVQVVTNENIQELIQNRSVPEFKAPVAVEQAAADSAKATATAVADSAKATEAAKETARGPDGKFVKTEETQAPKPDDTAAQAAGKADDSAATEDKWRKAVKDERWGDDLPHEAARKIKAKHLVMKEAEEFARDEYRDRKAAEARADQLQRELDALKNPKSGPDSSEGDEPKPEDFKTVGEYAKALTKYEVAQAKKAESAEQAKNTTKQQIETVQQQFAERIVATAKEIPDYYEVVEAADWEVPHHMQAYLVDSENGARLGYELSKDRALFDRIAKLSPIRAFAELGKLEDKLFAKKTETPDKGAPAASTQVSRAPAPITPLEGKSTTVAKDPSQMNFAELRAHRQAERAAGKNR